MTDQPETLVLAHLRRTDECTDRIGSGLRDRKRRMISLAQRLERRRGLAGAAP